MIPTAPTHRLVPTPAGRTHLVEQGSGPLVLLVHGFPECWYSWRHQLPALGEREAVVVGHDVGATVAATATLLRPDVFRAVGLLSVPFTPPGGPRPTEALAGLGGEEEFYVSYFQEPGRAEAEVEPDVRGWLAGFYAALSGDTMPGPGEPAPHLVARGGRMRDRFPTGGLPAWLGEEDLDVYAGEYERTGMSGALARYRSMDRDWAELAEYRGASLSRPALFVGGALDPSTTWMADAIDAHRTGVPGPSGAHVLEGCGHWVQQERPAEVDRLLVDWLADLPH